MLLHTALQLQKDFLSAAERGELDKVEFCIAAGVSIDCTAAPVSATSTIKGVVCNMHPSRGWCSAFKQSADLK